jgi:crotonobetainyl-CoA:carnitine CoA-transferase CaiB-like acyl-CoA transferase
MAPLAGLRVIEIGTAITAPLAGMMLADMGADVVKVEPPGGDQFRGGHGDRYGATFVAYNRNKRSIILDLATKDGRATLHRLVAGADVLLDNFRPGVLARLELDPDVLRGRHPKLIHCSITGFGAHGPYRTRPAFDAVGQALSGFASLFVDPANPQPAGPTISDNVTGMYACYAVLTAVIERARTGHGRRLEVNMLEATMAFIPDAFTNYTRANILWGPQSRVARSECHVFRCADGLMLSIQLSTLDKFWNGLIDALGLAECGRDPRFLSHVLRTEHYKTLQPILAERFLTRPRDEWIAALVARDVPVAPVLSIADVLANEQTQALGSFLTQVHPSEGAVTSVACPVLVDGARPLADPLPPPAAGEHTMEILAALDAQRSKGD